MDLTQTIREMEERLLMPDVRASRVALDALLADEFVEYSSSGRVWTKSAVIEALASSEDEPGVERTIEGFSVTALGDGAALATYRCVDSFSSGAPKRCTLRCSVWRKRGDEWELLFHQGTVTMP